VDIDDILEDVGSENKFWLHMPQGKKILEKFFQKIFQKIFDPSKMCRAKCVKSDAHLMRIGCALDAHWMRIGCALDAHQTYQTLRPIKL
jgi:hypothetical protein